MPKLKGEVEFEIELIRDNMKKNSGGFTTPGLMDMASIYDEPLKKDNRRLERLLGG